MKRNQKGSSNILIVVVLIAVVAVVGFYLLRGKTAPTTMYPNQQTDSQAIQSDSGLTNASNDLDNTDVDATLDPELNQNNSDAQTF